MIRILNTNLRFVGYMRKYTFNQYSVKFRGIGTFTINARLVSENLYLLDKTKQFFVLFDGKTERQFGIIEKAEKSSDSENEQIIVISGRMSLAILDKRVVYRTIKFRGQTYEFVKGVIEDNLISSDDTKRNMNINLELSDQMAMKQECTVINKQVTGGYLWDVIEPILEVDSLGIKFVPIVNTVDDDLRPNISEWDMTIVKGTDRRKGNTQGNVPVIFSQSVSNIKQTEYRTDTTQYRNYVYIAGEGEAGERKWFEKEINTADSKGLTGWNRTELWIDARDVQSEDAEGNVIPDSEYEELINDRINEKAEEVTAIESYDSTIIQENKLYEYGKDYFLGDFVTVIDKELNITIDVQITEVTMSEQGGETILDIGLTYGAIKRDPVEQININKKTSTVNENSIRYLEAKIKKLNTGGSGGGGTTPSPVTNIDNIQVNFDYASATSQREQINTGDTVKTLFKKIRKWFSDLKNVAFTGNYSDLSNKPKVLPNPYRLTFTGGENKVYDGSEAQSVSIPIVPDSIPADGGNADTIDNKNLAYLLDYNNHTNTPNISSLQSEISGKVSKSGDTMSGELELNKGSIVKHLRGISGKAGYINIIRLVVKDVWADYPLIFEIAGRGWIYSVKLYVKFNAQGDKDPNVKSFYVDNNPPLEIVIVKSDTSTWDIYAKKNEPYGTCEICALHNVYSHKQIEITFPNINVDALPEGYRIPDVMTWKNAVKETIYGGGILSENVSGTLLYMKNGKVCILYGQVIPKTKLTGNILLGSGYPKSDKSGSGYIFTLAKTESGIMARIGLDKNGNLYTTYQNMEAQAYSIAPIVYFCE